MNRICNFGVLLRNIRNHIPDIPKCNYGISVIMLRKYRMINPDIPEPNSKIVEILLDKGAERVHPAHERTRA